MNGFDKKNYKLWKWGIFYYNPNDPELIVEKRNGLGWTFNFAQKTAYIIFLIPVIFLLIMLIDSLRN